MWRISAAESTAAASVEKGQSVNVPTRPVSSTCLTDDAVRDPRGIFTDLAMPAVAAFAGPTCIRTRTNSRAMGLDQVLLKKIPTKYSDNNDEYVQILRKRKC